MQHLLSLRPPSQPIPSSRRGPIHGAHDQIRLKGGRKIVKKARIDVVQRHQHAGDEERPRRPGGTRASHDDPGTEGFDDDEALDDPDI